MSAIEGFWAPIPTEETFLYYCLIMELVSVYVTAIEGWYPVGLIFVLLIFRLQTHAGIIP
jgi:hypothetical protein